MKHQAASLVGGVHSLVNAATGIYLIGYGVQEQRVHGTTITAGESETAAEKLDFASHYAEAGHPWPCKENSRKLFGDTKPSMDALLRQLEAYGFSK